MAKVNPFKESEEIRKVEQVSYTEDLLKIALRGRANLTDEQAQRVVDSLHDPVVLRRFDEHRRQFQITFER